MDTKPTYWKEVIPNKKRRAPWHNYRSRCIYMVTITKSDSCPAFSSVGFDGANNVLLTPYKAGKIIAEEIKKIPNLIHKSDLCSQGRMLIISPQNSVPFSRESCLQMNALSAAIASM